MSIRKNIGVNGIGAAHNLLVNFNEKSQTGSYENKNIGLTVVRSRTNDKFAAGLFGESYVVKAILSAPSFGGQAQVFIRRVSGFKAVKNAAARCYQEAFQAGKLQAAQEALFDEFGKRAETLQNNENFVNAIEQAEKENNVTSSYSQMNVSDIIFWRDWLNKNLGIFEAPLLWQESNGTAVA